MVLTVSLVLLFGLALAFLLKTGALGPGSAFTAVIFGFLLAGTGAYGPVNGLLTALAQAVTGIDP